MSYNKLFTGLFFLSFNLFAQVGINTDNPIGVDIAINDDDTGIKVLSDGALTIRNNNEETLRINPNGFVGIGVNPAFPLDIDAENSFLRIDNLPINTSTGAEFLVIDPTTNEVGRRLVENTAGQIIRVGINTDFNPKGNPTNPGSTNSTQQSGEYALGFSLFDSSAEMGDTPAGSAYPNFINTITGSSFIIGDPSTPTCISATDGGNAGNGAPSRCTDQIVLPAGIYRVTVRISGRFENSNGNNALDIKVIVNNNEYSFANGVVSGDGGTSKSGYLVETLNLTDPSNTLDFSYVRGSGPTSSNFFILDSPVDVSGGRSFRNIITIEKLQ